MKKIDYTSSDVPSDYKCSKCGAHGVKLWRPYNTFCPELLCAGCAVADAGDENVEKLETMGPDGYMDWFDKDGHYMGPSCEINWNVPAIPDEEGLGYWGYTSVPDAGCLWWDSLPNNEYERRGVSHLKEKIAEDTTLKHLILWKITPEVWAIEEHPKDWPSHWSFYDEKEARSRWDVLVDRAKRRVEGIEEFNQRNKK